MATELFNANLASTNVLAGGTDAPPSGTSETWTVASSASFGAAVTGVSVFHVADPALNTEIIAVTNVSGNTWTVTRGAENTTPLAHAAGFNVYQVVTTGFLGSLSTSLTSSLTISPSGDASGVTDAANITAAVASLPSTGGQITLAPTATWYINCGGVVIARSGIYLNAPGVRINAVGTGDVIRMYDNTNAWPVYGGGILGYPVIDGTSAGAGSAGVHAGDLFQSTFEVFAQNFGGTGSIGVHFDNAHYWTEQMQARIFAQYCNTGVVFDVTGATTSTNSFARANVQIYINQLVPSFNGVTFQNGAYLYDGAIAIRGNFASSASSLSSAVLTITGTVPAGHPAAGAYAEIVDSRVEIGVETSSGTYNPQTIAFGNASNKISGCYGIMDFSAGPGTFATASSVANILPFGGTIAGDSVLTLGSGFSTKQTVVGPLVVENSGASALVVSPDGTTTSAGAFVVDVAASWFGIYATSNSQYYGVSYALPAPAGVAAIGGYYKGMGVGGVTNGSTAPIFGVLTSTQSGEGIGSTAFTVLDTNKVVTYHSTLDDGSGNATFPSGGITVSGGPLIAEASAGTNEVIVSTDGSATSQGAFVVKTGSSGFAGIYDTGNSLYYGISHVLPAAAGTSVLGGYFGGLGVGSSTHGTSNPMFGVLASNQSGSGKGNVAFTITDTNVIYSYNSTLDDGSGNMTIAGALDVSTAGYGLKVAEGSNAKQGIGTLASGAHVVANTVVTSSSRIFVTAQSPSGTPGALYISGRTAGTSFAVASTSGSDNSVFAYQIFEPG